MADDDRSGTVEPAPADDGGRVVTDFSVGIAGVGPAVGLGSGEFFPVLPGPADDAGAAADRPGTAEE